MTSFIKGDIHDVIKTIPTGSIDFIYTNPPFGTTEAEWDKPLRWDFLFTECFRVLKPNGSLILHCSIPFTYDLIALRKPKYHYVWKKDRPTAFMLAKRQPLRITEEVLVYYNKQPTYNPQMIGDEERISYPRNKPYNQYYGGDRQKPLLKRTIKGHYPNTLLDYKRNFRGDSTRPDEMVEYFIKTYTNEGDKILDLTCYNGLTGRIAKQLNRRYIGVDLRFHSDWVSLSTM